MDPNRPFDEAPLPLFPPADRGDEAAGLAPESGHARGRQPSYLADHRARLRDRFMQGGATAMPDYELLELVLFRAIPRQDVKPLARALIDRFGDFNRVLSAPPARLEEVAGVGPAVVQELKIVEAAAQRLARSRIMHRPVLTSWDALLDYCHTAMAHREIEQFRILYLDRKNVLIADEEQARGTVDHVPVYPREIMRRALELSASALILVHNHPSGDPTPSQADISMTGRIVAAAEVLGLAVHDHLIVGRSRELSFRAEGLL
ncbi:RadC family protein [Paracoccus broussonetiae]|uniref:DNA repair protein RadC n=1 Tax=Paracoccus broussonetiae subsp. drimophilus TaxID=3373869 RepID=A0ABW7LM34_9RHOB